MGIIILSWYGKGNNTTSQSNSNIITILSNHKNILILHKHTLPKKAITIISPLNTVICHPDLNMVSNWSLISNTTRIDSLCIPIAPDSWLVNSFQNYTVYPGWPKPIKLTYNNDLNGIKLSFKTINSNDKIQFLQINSISFLIISDTSTIDSVIINSYFEKIDILIISTESSETALLYHSQFRPRLCITTANLKSTKIPDNLIFLGDKCTSLKLSLSMRKEIITKLNNCN